MIWIFEYKDFFNNLKSIEVKGETYDEALGEWLKVSQPDWKLENYYMKGAE